MNKKISISNSAIQKNLRRIVNQIYKLLPCREESLDWQAPLTTIIEELIRMNDLIEDENFFSLICKLQGLLHLTAEDDFFLYRRIIFECLSLLNKILNNFKEEDI